MRVRYIILEMLFWMFAAGAIVFAFGVAMGLIFAPAVGYIAGVAAIGSLPLIVRIARAVRRRRAAMTLAYLEQAVRLNLPLPRMLQAAQQSERGRLGDRLAQLRDLIEGGFPVGLAIESVATEVGDREVSIIESAERVGRLPQSLARLTAEFADSTRRQSTADAAFYRAYPMVMLVVLSSAVSIFAIFVMPKFQAIFRDFGIALPPLTMATLRIADAVGPVLLFIVAAMVLIGSGLSLWQTIHPVRFGRTWIRQGRDHITWIMPVLRGIERDRGLADVFELLSDALSAGVTAERALAEASRVSVNAVLADKIAYWAQRAAEGDTIAAAARHAGLPTIVVGMLSSARDADGIVDVCGFLARYYRTRFSRAAAILEGISIPTMVLIFGVIVACVSLSMFLPMISLIDTLTVSVTNWRL